jgi:hypothetical protein
MSLQQEEENQMRFSVAKGVSMDSIHQCEVRTRKELRAMTDSFVNEFG